MIELDYGDYPKAGHFFIEKKQYIPALSVLQGRFPGRVFADNKEAPTLVIVWATGRWMYAEGSVDTAPNRNMLKDFFYCVVIPECTARNEAWFEVYTNSSEAWEELMLVELQGLKAQKHLESVYELNIESFLRYSSEAAEFNPSVQIEMNEWPIVPKSLHVAPQLREEFITIRCVGAAVKQGAHILALCKNNGFQSGREYFVDVDTFDIAERSKGYGTLAAAALIRYYLGKGMRPLWETTHENLASRRLALKLGFEPVADYPVFAFMVEGE